MTLRGSAVFIVGLLLCCSAYPQARSDSPLQISISFSEEVNSDSVDGRMLLIIARHNDTEPRFQIDRSPQTQQVFGIDVDGLRPGESARIDNRVFGNPLESLADIPAGDYWVQAVLHKYDTFHRADGHTVKLPMDRGEGQKWNKAPGNLFSTPKRVSIDPSENSKIQIELDAVIPPIAPPRRPST